MEKLDVAIAIAGAAVLAIAIAGSALTGVSGGGSLYALAFPLADQDAGTQTKDVAGSGTAEYTFEVKGHNVSAIEVTVEPTSQVPHVQADTLKITVTSPEGVETSGTGTSVRVEVAEPPAEQEVRAASLEAARTMGPAAAHEGMGTWKVRVDLTHPDPLPAPHAVKTSFAAKAWAASAQAKTASSR